MHRRAFLPALVLFASAAVTQVITIPQGAAATEGNGSNVFPWGPSSGLLHQSIYDSANFTGQGVTAPVLITRLRWRPDASIAHTWPNGSFLPATIRLSTCPLDQGSASTTFASNRGLDVTNVYSGLVAYTAGTSTPPGPAPFLVDVMLTTPFFYDPNAGDLNIECDLLPGSFTGSAGLFTDVQGLGSRSCRVYTSTTYGAPTGQRDLNHGVVVEVTCAPVVGFATASPYGTGCVEQSASFYENFATSATFDLGGSSMAMLYTGSGYLMLPGLAGYVPPSGSAQVLALNDDSEVGVALSGALPYPGGTTSSLTVCSNGFVSVASGNGISFSPVNATMLNSPRTAWWIWHDFNPTTAGSGQVKFEQIAGVAYVTWDGVFDFGVGGSPSTMQFQFDLTTGHVHLVWGTMSAGGNGYLVGYSPGGPSSDPGNRDISATLPGLFTVGTTDSLPLGLTAASRPISGTNCDLRTTNIPAGSPFGAILLGATQWNPGLSLTSIGMATCRQWNDGLASLLFVGPGATQQTLLPIPTGFAGTHVFAQSFVYCPGAGLTALGAIASGGVDLGVDNQ